MTIASSKSKAMSIDIILVQLYVELGSSFNV